MYVVYALIDPRYSTVRYIGMSKDSDVRIKQHLSFKDGNLAKIKWLQTLKASSHPVTMEILDYAVDEKEAREKEAFWIGCYHRFKAPLTNKIYPMKAPFLAPHNQGLIEFDMALGPGQRFWEDLDKSMIAYATINGAQVWPEMNQLTVYVNTHDERYWLYLTTRLSKRALQDRQIGCYRFRVHGYSWATFGDENYLKRREAATFSEDYPPFIEHNKRWASSSYSYYSGASIMHYKTTRSQRTSSSRSLGG